MPRLLLLVLFSLTAAASITPRSLWAADEPAHNTLTAEEKADGWLLLFDGKTLFGWRPTSYTDWDVVDGAIRVSVSNPGLLCTTACFGDFVLKAEFRSPKDTNSGIFLRTPYVADDPKVDCYELNIATPAVSPFPTGSLVARKKGTAPDDLSTDEWHAYEITAEGARIRVKLDGKEVLDYTDEKPLKTGHIGLQVNKGKVEFRNIKLKPLGLASMFNGKDLTGWRTDNVDKSVFAVNDQHELTLKNGKGQLESEGQYADFLMQLDVFVGAPNLNSGVFFRAIPNEIWNGYESQIQNAMVDGDPEKPVDFGTGAIYRRVKARRIVAKDQEWFTKTILAQGSQISVWVNGYQVTDWQDTRPANDNPRNGLRLAPGSILIQGHDPTTDFRFRNLKIVDLPPPVEKIKSFSFENKAPEDGKNKPFTPEPAPTPK